MGRFRHTADDSEETGIDISPLIDCVFILLIFFIVTTTFVEEFGVQVDKPQAASSIRLEENKSLVFKVTAKGEILCEGNVIGIGGIRTLVKAHLQRQDTAIIVQADPASQTSMLVRVVDEAKLAGADKVSLASK